MLKLPAWTLIGACALTLTLFTSCQPEAERLIHEKVTASALTQTPHCPIIWHGAKHKEGMDVHADGALGEVWESDFEWASFHITMNWVVIYQGGQVVAMKPIGQNGEVPFRVVPSE